MVCNNIQKRHSHKKKSNPVYGCSQKQNQIARGIGKPCLQCEETNIPVDPNQK